MPETPPNAELLRSLAQVVRGLSALFWGLPAALIVCVQTAKTEMLRPFNVLPPLLATGWLAFGLWHLGGFQKQERIWMNALDRAKLVAMVNVGLSPFLYWWNQMPENRFFTAVMAVMGLSGLLFLSNLNLVLHRLGAMLPDESLRQETRTFTRLNRILIVAILLLELAFCALINFPTVLPAVTLYIQTMSPGAAWLLVFLVLLPVAMTMALLWKVKEVILDGLFGIRR